MENTQLQDLFNSMGFSEEEEQEFSAYSFSTEGEVDDAIEDFKQLEEDEKRFNEIYKEKVDKLEFELQSKALKIGKKKDWILFNLKNSVMQSSDKKELKTMFKKIYLSGEVQVKKAVTKLITPKLTGEEVAAQFPDYTKSKTEVTLDWARLKIDIKIMDGKVIHVPSGEDISTKIMTETTAESVNIK